MGKLLQYRTARDRLSDLQAGKNLAAYCSAMKDYIAISSDVVEFLRQAQACPEMRVENSPDAIERERYRLIGAGIGKCLALEPEKR